PTRFIFVEGIIGSGKTTTAEFIAEQLRRNGESAHFLPEGPTIDEPTHALRIATTLPHPRAVWRDVSVDEIIGLSLRQWLAFVREAERSRTITVCDGLLFHGNMTDLLLMDAPVPVLERYVIQVLETIHDLGPVVVYLHPSDVVQLLRSVC